MLVAVWFVGGQTIVGKGEDAEKRSNVVILSQSEQ